jgi:hypothetical protein
MEEAKSATNSIHPDVSRCLIEKRSRVPWKCFPELKKRTKDPMLPVGQPATQQGNKHPSCYAKEQTIEERSNQSYIESTPQFQAHDKAEQPPGDTDDSKQTPTQ